MDQVVGARRALGSPGIMPFARLALHALEPGLAHLPQGIRQPRRGSSVRSQVLQAHLGGVLFLKRNDKIA